MTSVSGHLTAAKFGDEYERNWNYPPPDALFDAPVLVKVEDVGDDPSLRWFD
jgi:DNA topoisomerase III